MNGVSFGLPSAAYFNLSAGGSESLLDWVIGAVGEIFIDHKMMGLFSVLFGAGIVLFLDRAERRSNRPLALALWRNILLFGIGLAHSFVWEGDVLIVYALCAPFVIVLYKARPWILFTVGMLAVVASIGFGIWVQSTIPLDGSGLGDFWNITGPGMSDAVNVYLFIDFFGRAFGMMLIGVGLYRSGILSGERPRAFYAKLMVWGFGVGLPIAAVGVAIQLVGGFSPSLALIGEIPNTLATIPVVLGYIGIISLWNMRPDTEIHIRIRAVGRMALTNYLMQTVLGIVILGLVLGSVDLSRGEIVIFVGIVWALELLWSKPWLDRFAFGPTEWLWRSLTYRKFQPLRHEAEPVPVVDSL